MSVETHLYDLTCQVRDLIGCGTVNLLIGCPEPKLRHPLLDLFPTHSYRYMGSSGLTGTDLLLADEQVRALCDLAVQSGQVQSSNHVQMQYGDIPIRSIAAAPLERPGGVLGLFLLTDAHIGTFSHGEHLLLSSYLSTAATGEAITCGPASRKKSAPANSREACYYGWHNHRWRRGARG